MFDPFRSKPEISRSPPSTYPLPPVVRGAASTGCQKTLHWLYLFRVSWALSPLARAAAFFLPVSDPALHVSNFLVQAAELSIHPGLALLSGVAPVAGVGAALLAELTGHGVVNPADTLGHGGIDTRCVVLATADTPGNDTSLDVGSWVKLALADKGASTISLPCVLAVNSASADKRIVELEPFAESGGPEGGLALIVADNW